MHLLRNEVDHGIELPEKRVEIGKEETDIIVVTALRKESLALIKIEDDGCGINTEDIQKVHWEKGIILKERRSTLQEEKQCSQSLLPDSVLPAEPTHISGRGMEWTL